MRKTTILVAAALAALAVAGMGLADIPDGDGEIHACYDKLSGQVRIYDSEDGLPKGCGKNEEAISWNQIGPSGPSGPQGPQGEKGEKGPKGDPGPPVSIEGSACTTYGGDAGTIQMSVDAANTVKLTCVGGPPPPPPPPPADADADGFTIAQGDCNDMNRLRNPAETEIPNGVDDNCDGVVDDGASCDDGDSGTYDVYSLYAGACVSYPLEPGVDADGDGFEQPADCNDADPNVSPPETEVFNKVDDDCDALVDSDDPGAIGGP